MAEVLTGSFAAVSLISVLQLAESEALSGYLRTARGVLRLHQGAVVSAEFGELRGLDALMEMMLRPGPSFLFDSAVGEGGKPIGDLSQMLLEACRIMDEWARLEQRLLVPRTPLTGPLAPLMTWLDGSRPLAAAFEKAGLPVARHVDLLLNHEGAGGFEQLATPRPPPLPDDFDALMEIGRVRVKESRLKEALEAFERALIVRPDDRIATQNLRRIAALSRV